MLAVFLAVLSSTPNKLIEVWYLKNIYNAAIWSVASTHIHKLIK